MALRSTGTGLAYSQRMLVHARPLGLTGPGLLLMVLVGGQPASAQTLPANDASVPSMLSSPRVVVHVYGEPGFNHMADWRARMDALKAEASARRVPISDEVTNAFLSWGGTLLVRVTPRILVGGELGVVQDQDRFAVTEPIGGIFPGSTAFSVATATVGRNAQFVLAFYPREHSGAHFQVGAGMGQSHIVFSSRRARADGEGTGPIVSALFGTEWKMLYLTAGARFNRMRINYTTLDDLGVRSARDFQAFDGGGRAFLHEPNVDLSGVFVRVGVAFHWFRD
jgi:hypothetical protein